MSIQLPQWVRTNIRGPPLPSRKNLVFKVVWEERTCAAKVFDRTCVQRARTEHRMLELCEKLGIPAPRPLFLRGSVVMMTWVRGRSAFEIFESGLLRGESDRPPGYPGGPEEAEWGRGRIPLLLDGVAAWLARFHRALELEMRRGDAMLKNFICSGKVVYGIDFEEAGEGDPLADVGQLCAHILASGDRFPPPLFAAAGYLARRYWAHLGEDRSGELPSAVASGLEYYARYRSDGPLLRRWAKRIREEGL